MKKYVRIFLFLLAIAVSLSSCGNGNTEQNTNESEENIYYKEDELVSREADTTAENTDTDTSSNEDDEAEEASFLLLSCAGDPLSVRKKEIKGKYGGTFKNMLFSLTPTNEKSEKISDEPFSFMPSETCKAPEGTFWIETEGKIYRISSEKKEICIVEGHYTEGDVLSYSEELVQLLNELWMYYPRNTLYGTYSGTNVELKRVFEDEGMLSLDIKSIETGSDATPENDVNSITVTVTSQEDITLKIEAVPQNEDGEFAKTSNKTVTLEKGTPKEVTLTFGGWQNKTYDLNVIADTARIHLKLAH